MTLSPMDKAAAIVGDQLMPAAVADSTRCAKRSTRCRTLQIRACLVFVVFFDRLQQRDQPVTLHA